MEIKKQINEAIAKWLIGWWAEIEFADYMMKTKILHNRIREIVIGGKRKCTHKKSCMKGEDGSMVIYKGTILQRWPEYKIKSSYLVNVVKKQKSPNPWKVQLF